jgi:hypothetical protein
MDTIELYDVSTVAYLSLKGISATLEARGSKVFFLFPDDEQTRGEMINLQTNPLVPALSFISHLKRIRGRMLDARNH